MTFQFGKLCLASPGIPEFSLSFSVSWFQDVCAEILATREFPRSEVQPLLVRSHNICNSVFLLSWDVVIILFSFSMSMIGWEKRSSYFPFCVCAIMYGHWQ